MKDDTTFNLMNSTGWKLDLKNCEFKNEYDKKTGTYYDVLDFHVTKDENYDWKAELGEGEWYKHSNEKITLKHASCGNTLIRLIVHYESYVRKKGRKRKTDVIPFRYGNTGYTRHFKENVSYFMMGYGMTLSRCATICHTTPAIVKEINKERLFKLAGDMKPRHYSRYLCIDEFLIEHGHRYCTIIIDAETGELLYLEKGKKKEQLMHFFKWVGEDFMSHVEAISMDMNTNYSAAIKEVYPTIAIVYDTFHIIQWFNQQVIDNARRAEARRLKKLATKLREEGDIEGAIRVEEELSYLFNSRFLLLANEKTLEAKDKLNKELNKEAKEAAIKDGRDPDEVGKRKETSVAEREALLKSNANMQNIVRAREELSDILTRTSDKEEMREKLIEWCRVFSSVGVSQLTKFTKTIMRRIDGIVSRADYPISSGKIEGVNGFIKGLRRSAFGYQDFDYFALLIWEQTHLFSRTSPYSPSGKGTKRSYIRKSINNIKRLKQTVYKLDSSPSKEAC